MWPSITVSYFPVTKQWPSKNFPQNLAANASARWATFDSISCICSRPKGTEAAAVGQLFVMNHDPTNKTHAPQVKENWAPEKTIFADFLRTSAYKHLSLSNITLPAPLLITLDQISQTEISGEAITEGKLDKESSYSAALLFLDLLTWRCEIKQP